MTTYLRVIGRLTADGELRLRPSYLTDRAPWSDREGAGGPAGEALVAELLGNGERLLGRYPLRLYSTCAFGGDSLRPLAVRGWVPFPTETALLRIALYGRVVHEQRRSPEPPQVEITEAPQGRADGRVRVGWTARPGGDSPLQFFLRWSADGGRTWQRVGWRTTDLEAVLDVEELPGGDECVVEVVATDGLDTTTARTRPFRVAAKPCQAMVLGPVDGSEVGETVELLGQGWWLEERRAEREVLEWTSSVDGPLGRGPLLRVRLSPGEHRITLAAGDERRRGGESITVTVRS